MNKDRSKNKCEDRSNYKSVSNSEIFVYETERINKIIKKLNNRGNNLPLVQTWGQWYAEILLKDKERKDEKERNDEKNKKDEKIDKISKGVEEYRHDYLKYLEDKALFLIKTYDHCAEDIEEVNAEIILDKYSFRCNGFIQYIKKRIWEINLEMSEDEILNILILEWYDLSEKERKRYRKLGGKKMKIYNNSRDSMRKDNYLIENYLDIDIGWDSDEEWIE